MPQKECPDTINISNEDRSTLSYLLNRILKNIAFSEEEEGFFLDKDKREKFEIYLSVEQVPALKKFVKKLSGI